ncbi:S8 family serine peptidase [candidate division KSB1 bacterium]|nr:S8 family serine peptidase [candidate division KSB1 bacterium]
MRVQKFWLIFFLFSILVTFSAFSQRLESERLSNTKMAAYNYQIDKSQDDLLLSSELIQLYNSFRAQEDYVQFAALRNIKMVDNFVFVTVLPKSGFQINDVVGDLSAFGVIVEAHAKKSLRCRIPINRLKDVAEQVPGIRMICNLIRPVKDAVAGEGIQLMNADDWHAYGIDGSGVKVAIVDGGFDNLSEAQANGDIPATYYGMDYTGSGLESESEHGTAVAEATYEIAPGADYSFYHIGDLTDLENAKDDLVSRSVDVVNHSMSWFTLSYYDGTGPVCDIVADAINNDVVWCNSAGNSADSHYRAVFTEASDGFHDMDGAGHTLNFFGPEPGYVWLFPRPYLLQLWMNWDDYPASAQDYDLYLYRYSDSSEEWQVVGSATNRQNGDDEPVESIAYVNRIKDAKYAFAVKKYNATVDVDFTVFTSDPIANRVYSSSITDPGVYEEVVTVGAIARENYTSGPQEDFSGQGPTNDGRAKPSIAGPDNCNSYTYGYWQGTSQSSPYVTGLCALIRSSYPTYNESQTRDYLYAECTEDLGDNGFDYVYGHGKAILSETPIVVTLSSFEARLTEQGAVAISWSTASEIETAGFFIQRSQHKNAGFARIHDHMVLASGGRCSGATYEFMDVNFPENECYYRLEEVSLDGHSSYFKPTPVTVVASVENKAEIPFTFTLQQNYPNPFNPQTQIDYSISHSAPVILNIYDLNGRPVKQLVNQRQEKGYYSVVWDGTDRDGHAVVSGAYIYSLTAGESSAVRKMALIK